MRSYTYDEARAASVTYFGGDELASDVFAGKYALQDLKGSIYELTPSDMHRRLAREFARIEQKYPNPMSEEEIFDMLSEWDVVAQGSPMSAIGNPYQVQSLSNCFVIQSPYDSYGGIMKTDQEQVQIMKRRGGVGFDLSTIRPKGLSAANAARTTDGIAVFMERYSNTCREVAQGGRRGALMLTISVHHPEVLTFANIKRDKKKITGANVSVRMTDEFMQAAANGEKYLQRFPVDAPDGARTIEKWVDARTVWDNIVSAMRDCSEPGMLFWDTILKMGPADAYAHVGYRTVCTNPCGELVLCAYDSCRLILMNLWKFVRNPFTAESNFDYDAFSKTSAKAQRLMDDLVDLELEAVDKILAKIDLDPEPEDVKVVERNLWLKIKTMATNGRRTGLGVTGLGDMLAGLNLRYGEDASIAQTERVYKELALASYRSSVTMAKERGAFPIYDYNVECDHSFIRSIMAEDVELEADYRLYGRRNIANLTTSPAGSTSLMTQTTSGCEPVLFLESMRKRKLTEADKQARVDEVDELGDKWQHYKLFHPGLAKWKQITGETDIALSPYFGATVEEIDCLKKVDLQAAAQRWVDHSISNTTNLPEDVSCELVSELCMRAWKTGCKGVTIYRKNSRAAVIVDEASLTEDGQPLFIVETHAPKRPKELSCEIQRVSVKGEQYTVLVGLLNKKPYEVFAGLSEHVEVPRKARSGFIVKNGKKDGVSTYNLRIPLGDDDSLILKDVVSMFENPLYGALTRTISLALRHGAPLHYLVEQLKKDKYSDVTSFNSGIARVLKGYIADGTVPAAEKQCPNPKCTKSDLVYQGGCIDCRGCGWSKC